MARYTVGNKTGRALKFPREYYYPEALKAGSLTDQQMRQEYSRLRAIANKRLQRFEGTKYEEYPSYVRNVGKFVPLSKIGSQRELLYKLVDVSRFVTAKSSTVTGIREINLKKIEKFREHGVYFVNLRNIESFGEFMEWWRDSQYAKVYGSSRVADVFGAAVKGKGLDVEELKKNFEYFEQNLDALREVARARNKTDRTADEYRSRIDAYYDKKAKQEAKAAKQAAKQAKKA